MLEPKFTAVQLTGPTSIIVSQTPDGDGGFVETQEITGDAPDWHITYEHGPQVIISDDDFVNGLLAHDTLTYGFTLYVDPVGGNDEQGSGAGSNPLASVNRALELLEGKAISNCEITIQLADGTYASNPITRELTVHPYGTVSVPAWVWVDGVKCQGTGKLRIKAENPLGAVFPSLGAPATVAVIVARSNGVILDGLKIYGMENNGGGVGISQCDDVKVKDCLIADDAYAANRTAIYVIEAGNIVVTGCYIAQVEAGVYLVGNSKASVENSVLQSCKRAVQTRHSSYVAIKADVTCGDGKTITNVADQGGDVWRITCGALSQNDQDYGVWVDITGNAGITDGLYQVVGTGADYFDIDGNGQVTTPDNAGTITLTNEQTGVYASRASSASAGAGHGLTGGVADEQTGSGGYIE